MTKKWRAVFFDFDGVICQTEVYRMDRRELLLNRYGVKYDRKALYAMIGGACHVNMPYSGMMDMAFGDQEAYQAHRDEIVRFPSLDMEYTNLLTPGFPQVLQRLREEGIKMAVVSNSSIEVLETALNACGIREFFDDLISGWDLKKRKPDPYIYELAMQRLDVKPEQCAIIEDAPVGIQAGKAAGATVFALRDRDGMLDQQESDYIMTQITQLPGFMGLKNNQ